MTHQKRIDHLEGALRLISNEAAMRPELAYIKEIAEAGLRSGDGQPAHYPPGMGEESRRLHREYNALVEAQIAGARNGAEVRRVTDECAAKGIILVPGGENL